MYLISKEDFKRVYEENNKKKAKIVSALGVSVRTVERLAKRYGLKFEREKRVRTQRVKKADVIDIYQATKKAFEKPGISAKDFNRVHEDPEERYLFKKYRAMADKVFNAGMKLVEKGNVQFIMYLHKAVWQLSDSCTLTQNNYNVTESQRESDVVILEKETLE